MSLKKTYYQNPSIDDQKTRVEYVINQSGNLKNFRLLNFGVATYTPTINPTIVSYPNACGAYALIDTISLYSDIDGQLLSQVRNVGDVMAFKMLCDSQQTNTNIDSVLPMSSLNYQIEYTGGSTTIPIFVDDLTDNDFQRTAYIDLGKILPILYGLDVETYNKLLKEKDKRKIKKMLRDNGMISGQLKLRIVIEYSQLPYSQLFKNGNDADTVTLTSPTLAYDIYDDDGSTKSLSIVYDDYVTELVNTGLQIANASGQKRDNNYYLKGCIGRKVREITLMNKPTVCNGIFRNDSKNFCSTGLFNEQINFTINNELQFQNNAINNTTCKAGYLDYSKQQFTCPILTQSNCHASKISVTMDGMISYLNFFTNDENVISSAELDHQYETYLTGANVGTSDPALLGAFQYLLMYTSKRVLSFDKQSKDLVVTNA
jgi:hypothetical protein